ncbi:MAG: hypothetical protein FE834_05555 [Gammaproteobacteria bacterium]|nr:hypothetical protein [Gammaproteobacteria bacterium]
MVLEDLGHSLFFSNNTNCTLCHQLNKHPNTKAEPFTNHQYHNIGVPINTALRHKNGVQTPDQGLFNNPQITSPKQKRKIQNPHATKHCHHRPLYAQRRI